METYLILFYPSTRNTSVKNEVSINAAREFSPKNYPRKLIHVYTNLNRFSMCINTISVSVITKTQEKPRYQVISYLERVESSLHTLILIVYHIL
jgi:hypothetical protein